MKNLIFLFFAVLPLVSTSAQKCRTCGDRPKMEATEAEVDIRVRQFRARTQVTPIRLASDEAKNLESIAYYLCVFMECRDLTYEQAGDLISRAFIKDRGERGSTEVEIGVDAYENGETFEWVILKDGNKWMRQDLPGFFTWDEAQTACPDGWRLPTDNEWWSMIIQYGIAYNVESGKLINNRYNSGTEAYRNLVFDGESKFSAQLRGFLKTSINHEEEGIGYYWTSTPVDSNQAWYYHFGSVPHENRAVARSKNWKRYGFSCRCIEE